MIKDYMLKLFIVIFMCISLSITQVAYATNNVCFKVVIYENSSGITSSMFFDTWFPEANSILQTDNDSGGVDVSVDVVLSIDGLINTNYVCWCGDDVADSGFKIFWMMAALNTHPEDICGVTSIYYDGRDCYGLQNGGAFLIASSAYGCTVAHEVGHIAGLPDLKTGSTDRIMYQYGYYNQNVVVSSEKDNYESLSSPW